MGVFPVRDRSGAAWIWNRRPEQRLLFASTLPSSTVAFRRPFRVDAGSGPGDHPGKILVTADSRYRLYLDGRQLGAGPVRSSPSRCFLDEYDLSEIAPGDHVLTAIVRHYGRDTPWSLQAGPVGDLGRGGLLVLGDDLATDRRWRCLTIAHDCGEPVGVHGCPIEHRIAMPRDWQLAGFDDSEWDPAAELDAGSGPLPSRAGVPSAPFTLMLPRPLPALTDTAVEPTGTIALGRLACEPPDRPPTLATWHAASGSAGATVALPIDLAIGRHLTVDLGRIVVGVPVVTVAASAPCTITIVVGEQLDDRGIAEVRPRLQLTRLDHPGDGQPDVLTAFDASGFRYVTLTATADLTVRAVRAREERCPSDSSASFRSDDAELDRAWRASVRTREVCATDAYIDCPTREDRAWLGDLYVHAMIGYVATGDQRMTRRALELGAEQPRDDGLLPVVAGGDFARWGDVIPDYSLHWIRALHQYWVHTGDDSVVAALWPRIGPILEWFERFVDPTTDTLGPVPGWVLLDANPVPEGPLAPLQALLALTLADAATLLAEVGQRAPAAGAKRLSRRLVAGLDAFWSPETGAYLDAAGTEGVVTERMQALAILCGAASAARRRTMLAALDRLPRWISPGAEPAEHGQPASFPVLPDFAELTGRCVQTSPFFSHFLHQAYALAGRHDLLLTSIRRWAAFAEGGYDTVGEHWLPVGWLSSRCHAWSGTPAYDLSTHIAGVRPARPGYDHVLVAPRLGTLRRIAARVPTPHGDVVVDVGRDGKGLTGEVHLPDGVSGSFLGAARSQQRPLQPGRNEI